MAGWLADWLADWLPQKQGKKRSVGRSVGWLAGRYVYVHASYCRRYSIDRGRVRKLVRERKKEREKERKKERKKERLIRYYSLLACLMEKVEASLVVCPCLSVHSTNHVCLSLFLLSRKGRRGRHLKLVACLTRSIQRE